MTSTICHHTVLNLKSWTTLHWINYSRSLSHMAFVNSKTKQHFLSCKLTTGMGINFKEKLWNLARPGAGPSPDPQKIPPKKIKIYATIRSFLWKSIQLFIPHRHRLEPPQWHPGESPHTSTSRFQTADHHPKHQLTPVCSPLWYLNWKLGPAMYEIKISNCNIRKPSANAFQASFPNKPSLAAQLAVFLHKVASFIIPKTVIVWGYAAVKKIINPTYNTTKFWLPSPIGFSCLWSTRSIRLRLLVPTPIYWHSCSSRTFCHSLQLEWWSWWIFHF